MKRMKWMAVPALLMGLMAGRVSAATLFQDNFDTQHGGAGQLNYTDFAQWKVTRGSVDLIGNGMYDFYAGHGLYVDLDGTTNAGGRMEMKNAVSLAAGDYILSFDIGNNPGTAANTMTVGMGGLFSEAFTRTGSVAMTNVSRVIHVASATSAKITFDQQGGDNMGIIVDNVNLSSVPEPATLVYGLCALPMLGALRRRKK